MDESVDTDIIYFSSGLHFTFVTGPEWPNPFPKKVKFVSPSSEYTKTSLVSVPNAKNLPLGLTYVVRTLYGYIISATGPA
jgi:hypothetical protein